MQFQCDILSLFFFPNAKQTREKSNSLQNDEFQSFEMKQANKQSHYFPLNWITIVFSTNYPRLPYRRLSPTQRNETVRIG